MSEDLATVNVFRFNPKVDKEPVYETYKVPYKDMSVLQVLLHIQENVDPTLSFRYACRLTFCQSCVMLINGQPVKACIKRAEEKMTIEPHPKYEVLKDLIVDLDKVKKDYKPSNKPSTVRLVIDKDKCVTCGDCTKICPVGVWEIRGGKAYPADNQSCCGLTCQECMVWCYKNAIKVVPEK